MEGGIVAAMNGNFSNLTEDELRSLYESPGSLSEEDHETVTIELGARVMRRERREEWSRRWRQLRALAVLAALAGGAAWAYQQLDQSGMISHEEDSTITAANDWIVGESKDCTSPVLDADTAAAVQKETGYAFSEVSCDDGPEHQIKIRFYGQQSQPEHRVVLWHCTRAEDSFTCKETGAR